MLTNYHLSKRCQINLAGAGILTFLGVLAGIQPQTETLDIHTVSRSRDYDAEGKPIMSYFHTTQEVFDNPTLNAVFAAT